MRDWRVTMERVQIFKYLQGLLKEDAASITDTSERVMKGKEANGSRRKVTRSKDLSLQV